MMAVVAIVTSCIMQTWRCVLSGACCVGLARPSILVSRHMATENHIHKFIPYLPV